VRRFLHALAPWLVVAIFVGAVRLVYRELKHYHYDNIVQSLHQIPTGRVWAAVALTAINYAMLAGYDLLAVRWASLFWPRSSQMIPNPPVYQLQRTHVRIVKTSAISAHVVRLSL
jgi:hypothetical protein